jgi:hypothetical protein
MNRVAIISIGCLSVVVLFVVIIVGYVISTNNSCVAQEKSIEAQYKQNQNNYDNMWKKFKEIAAVPAMYTEDLKKVYDSAIQKRYGKEGSQAMFQWLKEHNPQFDSSIYKQIQQVIEAGRNSFEANQKMLLDKKRAYETDLDVVPKGNVCRAMGFPKIDLAKFDIVTSDETEKAFKDKKAGVIKLRE